MARGKVQDRDGVFERKDRKGWWISYVDAKGARRKEKAKDAHTLTQAREALRRVQTKVERERTLGVKEDSDITTDALLERFRRYQKARLRPTTYKRLDGIIATLKASLPASAKAITKRDVANYIEKRTTGEDAVSPATVAKEVQALKHCLKLAVEWGELHHNAATGARLPKLPEGKTRYLTPGELRATLETAPEWMRAPIAFAAATGMRRGEMLALRWMDVDRKQARIYLRSTTTKSGALRILPLTAAALQVLDSLPEGGASALVFAGVDAAKLSVYTRRLFASLGIEDASLHTLRHTAASWMVQEGVDLYAVGQFLGHKTPRMTQRYAHLSPEYMATAAGRLSDAMTRAMLPAETVTSENGDSGEEQGRS